MPMQQMPILEIDGKVYHQSKAISRFIAKKGNLYGSNELEAMEIDATVDSIEDIRQSKTDTAWKNDRPSLLLQKKENYYMCKTLTINFCSFRHLLQGKRSCFEGETQRGRI